MTVFSAQELLRRHDIAFVETRAGKYTTKCPNCSGGYLNVKLERDRVAWFCHSCDQGSAEKYDQPERRGELGEAKATYDYLDENGKLLFQALRFEPVNGPKQFRQRTGPDQQKWSIKGVRIVPFRLPELIDDLALERVVFVVEGERDVMTLRAQGVPATCNPMGAGKWWPEFNEILRGADVVICGDNDEPGRNHAELVARNLAPIVKRLRLLDLATVWPEIQHSDDISDWFTVGGGTVERLWAAIEPLPDYQPRVPNGNGHDQAEREVPAAEARSKPAGASVYTFPDPAQIPPRAWLYGEHYIRGAVTATVAPGGTGKTTLSLFEAITMAAAGLCVWYLSGEDPRIEIDRRIAAHMQHHNLDPAQIAGRLFVDDRASFPLKLTKAARGMAVVFDDAWVKAFERAIERDHIDVVVIDPFVAFHNAVENDNAAMDAVIKRLGETCARFNCNIEVSHHVRKPAAGMAEITVDDARGGGALVNATRSCRVINRMPSDVAVQENIPPDKRTGYLRLDNGKRNMAPPGAASWWHLVSVLIGNGADNVQAIERYRIRGPFDAWTLADTDAIAELVKAGDMRADPRSEKWLGLAVLERLNLNGTRKEHFAKANKMISTWLANGLFKKIKLLDPEIRKERSFYVPMDYREPHDLEDQNA